MIDTLSPQLRDLNAEQIAAVTAGDGPILVVAGPGSGKTRVLTQRIAHLISERDVAPSRILAVTFTNKAAREMRERVDAALPERDLDGLIMGTFHALGVRILRENSGYVADRLGVLRNFTIYDDADQMATAKTAVKNADLDPKNVAPRRMLSRISAAKSVLLTPDDIKNDVATYDDEIVARVYREYQQLLAKANAVDFDDLLGLPIKLFDLEPALLDRYQQRFQHILVDEYQDTNRVQYVLVSALSEVHRNIFVVGDPDQSIYRWRQADIRNILDFESDFPDATRIDLEQNYRSTARIIAVADTVIRENRQRIDRKLRTDNDDGEPITIRELADQQHEAQFVVDEIRRLMASEGLRGSDFAVMYRTTAQSRVLEEAFRTSEIGYQIVGGVRFYERKEVKDILAVLKLLHNSRDTVSLERVVENMPVGRGIGPRALESLRSWADSNGSSPVDGLLALAGHPPDSIPPDVSGSARSAGVKLGNVLKSLNDAATSRSLVELFDELVEVTGYRASFDRTIEDDIDRWENVLEVRSDLEKYDLLKPGEALTAYLEQVALVADVDSLQVNARDLVTLITLHSAKGLEFPVVFIAGLEDGLLPISRAIEAEYEDPAAVEEERRLFYVGITRAEARLYLTYVSSRLTYGRYQQGTQSRFLDGLPQQHVRDLGRRRPVSARGASRLAERARAGIVPSTVAVDYPETVGNTTRTYAVDERVFHPKFGEGRIVEVNDRHADQEVAVEFARHGQKRLLASFARLDLIDD